MRWSWFFVGVGTGFTVIYVPRALLLRGRPAPPRRLGDSDVTVAPVTHQTLKIAGVVALQRKLMAEQLVLHETGELDAQTQLALRSFQTREGIAATGFPDFETLRRLELEPSAVFRRLTKLPPAFRP